MRTALANMLAGHARLRWRRCGHASCHRPGERRPSAVSREEWLERRRALLREEKAFFREHDRLKARRRALPWVGIGKAYGLDGPDGRESLADLFVGRHQLLVYHFMFGPQSEAGCAHCSFWSDHYDGAN